MSTPSSRICPSVGRSNPAIMRSVVVLPHPDGPSSEKNCPAGMSRSMPSTAGIPANDLASWCSRIAPPLIRPAPSPRRGDRGGERGEVARETVDIVDRVLNRQQPLLHLPPWREEHATVVLHEPVQVPQPGVDLEEVAELADRLPPERHTSLGTKG